MKVLSYDDVELGDDLPGEIPDVSMSKVTAFCTAAKHVFERFVNHEAARKVVSSSDSVITVLPSFWTATKPPSSLHRFTVWQNTLSSIRQSNNNKCSNPPDLKPNPKPSPFSLSIFFFSLKCFFALKKIFL